MFTKYIPDMGFLYRISVHIYIYMFYHSVRHIKHEKQPNIDKKMCKICEQTLCKLGSMNEQLAYKHIL